MKESHSPCPDPASHLRISGLEVSGLRRALVVTAKDRDTALQREQGREPNLLEQNLSEAYRSRLPFGQDDVSPAAPRDSKTDP